MLGIGVVSASIPTLRRGWFEAPQPVVDRGVDRNTRPLLAHKLQRYKQVRSGLEEQC